MVVVVLIGLMGISSVIGQTCNTYNLEANPVRLDSITLSLARAVSSHTSTTWSGTTLD